MQGYLIIDDLKPALALLSGPGFETIATPAEWVRTTVLEHADRRGWSVVRHATFAEWALSAIASDERQWLALDPLLPLDGHGTRARRVRLTRTFDGNATFVNSSSFVGDDSMSVWAADTSASVGVVDDAVASGRTMTRAARLVAQAGCRVRHVATCASTRLGRDTVRARLQYPRWSEYLPGDWAVMHLRDGCPHVPYAGMPAPSAGGVADGGSGVELRVLSSAVAGHPWQWLMTERQVRQAVRDALAQVAASLGKRLGRPATVGDLASLGPGVPAMVLPGMEVDRTTLLERLIPS